MGPATSYFEIDQPFAMYRGGSLPGARLAWESWGTLNEKRDNAVLLFTGLSPSAHAASGARDPEPGWWEEMIGPGKPVDTDRHFVICVNSLGSCMGSTGPASIEPATGKPWRLRFPELALEDIAAANRLLLDDLGIEKLAAVIGPSMGGMSALAWIKLYPGSTGKLALISSAAAATPFAISIRSLQREAIVSDRNFLEGRYSDERWPETGMRIARKLGMITYRSAGEWQQRFGRQLQDYFPPTVFGMRFAVESYLESHARKFVGSFDPACYLYLSRAMDLFDACDRGSSLPALFRRAQLDSALVLGVESDILFPLQQQQALADALTESGVPVAMRALPSIQGHDAFLIDFERFGPPLAEFLE